jgi:hypothetical protein
MLEEAIERNRGRLEVFAVVARLAGVAILAYYTYFSVQSGYLLARPTTTYTATTQVLLHAAGALVLAGIFPAVFLFAVAAGARWLINRERPLPRMLLNLNTIVYVYTGLSIAYYAWRLFTFRVSMPPPDPTWYEQVRAVMPLASTLLALPTLAILMACAVLIGRATRAIRERGPAILPLIPMENARLLRNLGIVAGITGGLLVTLAAIDVFAQATKYWQGARATMLLVDGLLTTIVKTLFTGAVLLGVYGTIRCVLDHSYAVPRLLKYADRVIIAYVVLALVDRIGQPIWLMVSSFDDHFSSRDIGGFYASVLIMVIFSLVTSVMLVVWALFAGLWKRGIVWLLDRTREPQGASWSTGRESERLTAD